MKNRKSENRETAVDRVKNSVREKLLSSGIGPGEAILIALSGGKDSSCLADVLWELKEEFSFSLAACHVNHRIRPEEETKADRLFCEKLCGERQIPLFCAETDIPLLSGGVSVEECARRERYRILKETAAKAGCTAVATAHTATDSAETVLFNLLRGASGDGLCGIPLRRGDLIRPLLGVTSDEVVAYCREKGIAYRTDSTNSDPAYTRNLIRNEISPLLRKINPSFENTFSSLAASLAEDRRYFDSLLPPFTGDREEMKLLPEPLLSRLLKKEAEKAGASFLGAKHLGAMTDLVRKNGTGRKTLSLPGKVVFSVEKGTVSFEKEKESESFSPFSLSMGENPLPGGMLFVSEREDDPRIEHFKRIYNLFISQPMKYPGDVGKICVRLRVGGERLKAKGMTRSVKKMLQATGLCLGIREKLPFLLDEKGLFFVPFLPIRDDLFPDKEDRRLYIFYFCSPR